LLYLSAVCPYHLYGFHHILYGGCGRYDYHFDFDDQLDHDVNDQLNYDFNDQLYNKLNIEHGLDDQFNF